MADLNKRKLQQAQGKAKQNAQDKPKEEIICSSLMDATHIYTYLTLSFVDSSAMRIK